MLGYILTLESGKTKFVFFKFMAYFRAGRILRRKDEIVVIEKRKGGKK